MLVPLAGRILQIHSEVSPGSVIHITTGAMQNASAVAKEVPVRLHLEERNRVKLTEASTESSPAAANRHCSSPMFISISVTMEYII